MKALYSGPSVPSPTPCEHCAHEGEADEREKNVDEFGEALHTETFTLRPMRMAASRAATK